MKNRSIAVLASLVVINIALAILILRSCDSGMKNELIEYYKKSTFSMTGIITGKTYIQKNIGILNVDVKTSSVDVYLGKVVFLTYPDIELADHKARVVCGYFDELKINDSIVIIMNEGLFRVYRNDSLMRDVGLKYYKNGKEVDL